MAGGINLTPHVPVILGQGLLFALAYGVVYRWIVVPYNELRQRRDQQTSGVMDDVSDVSQQILHRRKLMKQSVDEAFESIKELRARCKEEALEKARVVVEEAHKKADEELKLQVASIDADMHTSATLLSEHAEQFTKQILDEILRPSSQSHGSGKRIQSQ